MYRFSLNYEEEQETYEREESPEEEGVHEADARDSRRLDWTLDIGLDSRQ